MDFSILDKENVFDNFFVQILIVLINDKMIQNQMPKKEVLTSKFRTAIVAKIRHGDLLVPATKDLQVVHLCGVIQFPLPSLLWNQEVQVFYGK